jgi:hypothetical protein
MDNAMSADVSSGNRAKIAKARAALRIANEFGRIHSAGKRESTAAFEFGERQ